MELRVEMAEYLVKLRKKMQDARANHLPQVADAIAAIRNALAD
jgi:hypothetical protein